MAAKKTRADIENVNNDWSTWSLYIIKTIESLQDRADELEEDVHAINIELQTELMKFKVYSKIVSIMSGLITSIIVSIIAGCITYYMTEGVEKKDIQQPQSNIIVKQQKQNNSNRVIQ